MPQDSAPVDSPPESEAGKLYEEGRVDEAFKSASSALRNARLDAEDDATATPPMLDALEVLAMLYGQSGEFEKAESLYIEALDTGEKSGATVGRMARLRSGLATLYDFNQQEERAVPLYERAIENYESMQPPLQEMTAQLRNNLAMIYKSLNRHSLAEQHYLVALEILEKLHGRNDERVAAVYNNIGSLYHSAGHAAQAKEMHLEALEIRTRVFGAENPEVAQSFTNLATACYDLHDDQGAQDNYEKALAILENHFAAHADTYEQTATDYAGLLDSIGEPRRAEAVRKRLARLLKHD